MINRAMFKRRLDAAGEFSADMPLTDPRTASAIPGRVYAHYQEGEGFAFAGSIEQRREHPVDALNVAGDSLLIELMYHNTHVGREYTNETVDAVVDSLLAGTGWVRSGSVTDTVTVRFDGESILRAVLVTLDLAGAHCREVVTESGGVLTRKLEIGAFGTASGVVCMPGEPDPLMASDRGIAYIEDGSFSVEDASTEVWNYLIPLGAGEGATQLTLVQQTRLPNLLTNPSFEAGLDGWTINGADIAKVDTHSVHGDQAVYIDGSQGDNERLDQAPTVTPGQVYRVEAWAWVLQAHLTLHLEWHDAGETTLRTDNFDTVGTGQWELLDSGELTAPANATHVHVFLHSEMVGEGYFDLPRIWRVASDAGQPYDILTALTDPTLPHALLNWYISDPASITTYGARQRTFVAKDIVPLAFTKPAFQVAANSLYDLAAAALDRWKQQQVAYSMTVVGLDPDVLPGDTVRLRYKGLAERAGEPYLYVDVEDDLYVLERQSDWDDYKRDTLLVSDLDKQLQNDDDVVIGKLEDTVRAFRTHVQTSVGVWAEHLGPEEVNASNNMVFNARIPDNVVQLLRCLMTITPRNIRSPVNASDSDPGSTPTSQGGSSHSHSVSGQTALGSGDHTHTYPLSDEGTQQATKFRGLRGKDQNGNILEIEVGSITGGTSLTFEPSGDPGDHTHSVTSDTSTADTAHTHDVVIPSHSHALTFGIFEGTPAAGIGVTIDGTVRTTNLGGPFSSPTTVDITRFLLDADSVVVRGDHTIELSSSQLGRIEVRLEWAVSVAALAQ